MTPVRKYLSRVDEAGRLVIFRSDGQPITMHEREWFADLVTRQLRTDAMMTRKGYLPLGDVMEENGITAVKHRRSGERVPVHPLIHELKRMLGVRKWNLATTSEAIGLRKTALSEWMRGMMDPTMRNVAGAFGAMGYRLVPVPITDEHEIRQVIDAASAKMLQEIHGIGMEDYTLTGDDH
jgi:hypothetical protein